MVPKLMKVLLLVQKEQRVILDSLYKGIEDASDCDTHYLTGSEQDNLKKYFKDNVVISNYDRIIIFLRFKKELKQILFIRTIPNLVVLEHDAYQNYIDCKYKGKFSYYYSKMPWVRVLSSGATVTKQLKEEGFDAVFIPKGYDQGMLYDQQQSRDIELAFVGSIKSATYSSRKALLDELAQREEVVITRTKSGDEYLNTLNRIRFFVSADMGMGEYMIKNFEAMACGCVLVAYDHGQYEVDAVGFVDMHNVILYKTVDELIKKVNIVKNNGYLEKNILKNSKKLVQDRFAFSCIGEEIISAITPALRPQDTRINILDWLRIKLGV